MRNWKLVSFDLDGTLIKGTSSAEHLSWRMGDTDLVRTYEAKYTSGEITNVEFGNFDAARFQGYSKHQIHEYLDDLPLIDRISDTVDYLASKNVECVISTMAWDFVAEFVASKHGICSWSGPSLELDSNELFTGKVKSYFHETEKVSFVKGICTQIGCSLSDVIHIGDSTSDFPLFAEVGHAIALNGSNGAGDRAHVSISSGSLYDVLGVLPDLD